MHIVYCANCGQCLNVTRRALPKHSTIINIVEYHECSENPLSLDLHIHNSSEFKETEGKNKFVLSLNNLKVIKPVETQSKVNEPSEPKKFIGVGSEDLRDRRFEKPEPVNTESPTSAAPKSVLDMIKGMEPSSAEHKLSDLEGPESEE